MKMTADEARRLAKEANAEADDGDKFVVGAGSRKKIDAPMSSSTAAPAETILSIRQAKKSKKT